MHSFNMTISQVTVNLAGTEKCWNQPDKATHRARLVFNRLPSVLFCLLIGTTVIVLLLPLLKSTKDIRPVLTKKHTLNVPLHHDTLNVTLEKEVRVACWILTNPKNHKTKAKAVKETWGKRCTKLLFVTTEDDDELDTLFVDVPENYDNIWGKTRNAFKYLYENHLEEYDWFMKADDDTYIFMENLRYLLYPYSAEYPIWFGYNNKMGSERPLKKAYMSGGSSYTLSRGALRRFGNISLNTPSGCRINDNNGPEDLEMGLCLHTANVIAGDSRDTSLKLRYDIFNPHGVLQSNVFPKDFWYGPLSFFHTHNSRESLSEYAVGFHYIPPVHMRIYDFLKYEFEVVGLEHPEESLPLKILDNEIVEPISDN